MKAYPTTLIATRQALAQGELSAHELVDHTLHTLQATNPTLNNWLEILADEARGQAHKIDKDKTTTDPAALLAGIPIAIKDMISTREGHTTAGSKMLASYRAPYEATVVKKLKAAGAIIIGKTNLDEFAMGSSNEYSAFGAVKNPWDSTRVPGGSSGGSAVAVAAEQVVGALGTDTGGSIRLPASFCNVVGVKPTYGRVSRHGVIAYGSSLDQVGPFARTVQDAARLLRVIAGRDTWDATSSPLPVPDYEAACGQSIKGVRIGVPHELMGEGLNQEVKTMVETAIKDLVAQGAVVVDISLPLTAAAVAVYYLIVKSEASTNLARYDALRFAPLSLHADDLISHYRQARGQGFGPEVKRALLMGGYALSAGYYDAWYKQASKVRTLIRREYEAAFSHVDIIACPVSPEAAFPLGSKANDPLAMYLADALTVPMSVAGVTALSLPCGFTADNLPVGVQLVAPHFKEDRLFQVASVYEALHTWWQQPLPSAKS